MRIGIRSSHAYNHLGGGYQALRWHILAFRALGHDVTFYTTNTPSEGALKNWFDNVPIRFYYPGCEKDFDFFINIDHFSQAQPLAKKNAVHTFFPHPNTPPPAEGVEIYSNSAYTARHIQLAWGRKATPMYIPIDSEFYSGDKDKIILHVSRFSEPSEWADKGHRQMIQSFKLITKNLPGWRLVLAGSVDPLQNYYLDELVRLSYGYDIDFMPNLPQKSLVDLLARSSIYWHATGVSLPTIPSAQEHMGIAPIEAQASGCVPIVFNSGGMPEVVVSQKTGLLFDNIMDLPHLTRSLLNDMTSWAQMSQAGQVWARTWADFGEFTQRIDDMLNERPISSTKVFQMSLRHSPNEVTAVIPTYNSPLLQDCLESLKKTASKMHVLIINNGDSPLNLGVDDNVEIIEVGENLGFAKANRLASTLVKTPFVLMLNDDVIADRPGWLEQLLFIMNSDQVGVVGSKLFFRDGRLQFAGGIVDWRREDIGYHRAYGSQDGVLTSIPQEVDFITGACLLCRKELYEIPDELLDGLDFEDTWLCLNAKEKGFKVVYQPASSLVHAEGQTKQRSPDIQEKVERNRDEFKARWMK